MEIRKAPRLKRVVVGAILAALVSLVPAPSPAVIYHRCGGFHPGEGSCSFTPVGGWLGVYGTGAGFIAVNVTTPTGSTIFQCYSFEAGQCGGSFGGAFGGTEEAPIGNIGPLTCEVYSLGPGQYQCTSSA
jgi:hypothetical protein